MGGVAQAAVPRCPRLPLMCPPGGAICCAVLCTVHVWGMGMPQHRAPPHDTEIIVPPQALSIHRSINSAPFV